MPVGRFAGRIEEPAHIVEVAIDELGGIADEHQPS